MMTPLDRRTLLAGSLMLGASGLALPRIAFDMRHPAANDGNLHRPRIGPRPAVEIDFGSPRRHAANLAVQNLPRTEKAKTGPISRLRSSTKAIGLSPRTPV